MKIAIAPSLKKLSYWERNTIEVFEGFAFIIKACLFYKLANKKEETCLVSRRLFYILKNIIDAEILDELALEGLIWELMGDCCALHCDETGKEYYRKAQSIYEEGLKSQKDFDAIWEVQEEFEAASLLLTKDIELTLVHEFGSFDERINKKISLLKEKCNV